MAPITPAQAQMIAQGTASAGNFMSELFFNKRRKQEAETAYNRQVDFWNMQNEYNSPASQMARYKAAGLNPNLIYGQGNPGNATASPKYEPPAQVAPKMGSIDFLGIAHQVMQMKQSQAQIDLIEQQKRNLKVEEDNKTIYGNILNIKSLHDNLKYGFDKDTYNTRVLGLELRNQLSEQTKQNMLKMYEKLGYDIESTKQNTAYRKELTDLASKGLGLRSPSALESILYKFFDEIDKDKGQAASSFRKSSPQIKALSTNWLGTGGFLYQLLNGFK